MKQLPIVLFKDAFLRRLKHKTNLSISISIILPAGHISTKVMWHIFFCSRHGREDLKISLYLFSLSLWFALFSAFWCSLFYCYKLSLHLYLLCYYTLSEYTMMACERGFGRQIPCLLHRSIEDQWFQDFCYCVIFNTATSRSYKNATGFMPFSVQKRKHQNKFCIYTSVK